MAVNWDDTNFNQPSEQDHKDTCIVWKSYLNSKRLQIWIHQTHSTSIKKIRQGWGKGIAQGEPKFKNLAWVT